MSQLRMTPKHQYKGTKCRLQAGRQLSMEQYALAISCVFGEFLAPSHSTSFNDEGLMNASDRRQMAHHNGLLNPKELAKSTTFKRQSQENTIIPEVSKSPDAFNTEKPSNAMTPKCKFPSYGKTE